MISSHVAERIGVWMPLAEKDKKLLSDLIMEGLFMANENDLPDLRKEVSDLSHKKIICCSIGDNYLIAVGTNRKTYIVAPLEESFYNYPPLRRRFTI